MDKEEFKKKMAPHKEVLDSLLEELKQSLVKVVNLDADITELQKVIERIREFRQLLNNLENIGIIIGPAGWRISGFPLTGDRETDMGQIVLNLPKNEIN